MGIWLRNIVGLGLLVVLNVVFFIAPRGSYDAVVVHHAAAETSDYRAVRRAHWARGWSEIAYHFVLSNGSTDVPFGHLYPTRRYTFGLWSVATRSFHFNTRALHLCAIGNFENGPVPSRLRGALGHALKEILTRHDIPPERIFLHRDCSATACPGRHVDRDKLVAWTGAGEQAGAEIKAQHRAALGRFRLSSWGYGAAWLALHGGLFGVLYRRARSPGRSSDRDQEADSASRA